MYFLLTAPHPDDDVIGLGDYIQHIEASKVGVWFMTDGGDKERRVEATRALNLLGVNDIFWNTLPFYTAEDRRVSQDDYDACASFLNGICPSTIAVCYDADPHKTHIKCYTILQHAMAQQQHAMAQQQQKGGACSRVVLYQSAWGNRTSYSPRCEWTQWKVKDPTLKRAAVSCHRSQLTLTVHDGFGDDLLRRGNLHEESFMELGTNAFCTWPPCA